MNITQHSSSKLSEQLSKNVKKYCNNAGFQKVILGISGGIDSAVTLAIAVDALGSENVHTYLMPYKLGTVSSRENFEDAEKICRFFHIPEQNISKIPLDTFARPYEKIFPMESLSFANSLARIRMTLLFGYANSLSALVLGTCNKSEIMLGYETKFGDGACDINVLGNLWKSQVYALAKFYNIPEIFITKKPSAELFEGHFDEQEMGFSYDQAEHILTNIEIDEQNFSPTNELEKKIFTMWKASEHKRVFPPTISVL